jgi:hypothetical protein
MSHKQPENAPNRDAPPDEDWMERRPDKMAEPARRLGDDESAESREPGYQDIDDRDGV